MLACLLALTAPLLLTPPLTPPAPQSNAPASAIDWANHAFTMFTLRDGIAELREYPMDGTAHDSQLWQFKRAEPVIVDGVAHTLVIIRSAYSAPRVSRESLTAYLFQERAEVGRPITVPTETARITLKDGVVTGRWRVGIERFSQRWKVTRKGLISLGNPARMRPRTIGH